MNNLICPLCRNLLEKNNNSYLCKNNHTYDISSSGYANLLLANQKKSLDPGDNKIMVSARKNFLDKGYFLPLSEYINTIISDYITSDSVILDGGCGTGYYLNNLLNKYNYLTCIGIDISKYAIMTASKQNQKINYFVSSIFDLPIKSDSVNVILNIFAPKPEEEFKRVLGNSGIIIEVIPSMHHLYELKKIIYGDKTYLTKEKPGFADLKKVDTKSLSYTMTVPNSDLPLLVKMTPYFYRTPEELLTKIYNIQEIELTFDFTVNIYQK